MSKTPSGFFSSPSSETPLGDALGEYVEMPTHEKVGSVLYDTLDFDERFDPGAEYKLFLSPSRPGKKTNMDCCGCMPASNSFDVLSLGVRVDMDGPAAEDALHVVLRSAFVTLHLSSKEWIHLPLATLYPCGNGYRPVISPTRGTLVAGQPASGPYRSVDVEPSIERPGPPLLPTVHGAIEVETGPWGVDLDALGRPSWLRGGFCRFAFVEPPVRIAPNQQFFVLCEFSPSGGEYIKNLQANGLFKGELVVYLGGVRQRSLL